MSQVSRSARVASAGLVVAGVAATALVVGGPTAAPSQQEGDSTSSSTTEVTVSTTTVVPTTSTPTEPQPTTSPPPTGKVVNRSKGPGRTEWFALSVQMPSTVTVGQTFQIRGTCDPSMAGSPADAGFWSTPTANPPEARGSNTAYWVRSKGAVVGPDGSFVDEITVNAPPGTYYVRVTCSSESWVSDALLWDDEGNMVSEYYEFPDNQLRQLTVLTAPAQTPLPPTE